MNKKVLGLLASATLFLGACSTAANTGGNNSDNESTVKIGANFELSGRVASYGQSMLNAVELAVSHRNANSGVLGKQVELITLDNTSDTKEAASVATTLAERNVAGIVGPATTGNANAQSPVATEAKVPVVLPAATGDSVVLDSSNKVLDYIFRVAFSDSYQGQSIAQFLDDNLQAKKVVLLRDTSSDYAKGLSETFIKHYSGEIVATENFTSNDSDFNAILTNIRNLDFDTIVIAGYYEQAGPIIRQAREMGISQRIVGGDGFASNTLVELAGAQNVTNVFYANHFTTLSTDEKVQQFLKAYEEKTGKQADAFAALAYDATGVLLQAIANAGTTETQAVKDALAQIKDYEGVTGTFSIDATHNVVKSTYMIELTNGVETGYTLVEPK